MVEEPEDTAMGESFADQNYSLSKSQPYLGHLPAVEIEKFLMEPSVLRILGTSQDYVIWQRDW